MIDPQRKRHRASGTEWGDAHIFETDDEPHADGVAEIMREDLESVESMEVNDA